MHFIYVLQSEKDHSFYIGSTNDLKRRLQEHNNGLSLSTKNKTPWMLIYVEVYRSRKDGLERERKLKKHKTGWVKLKERLKNSVFAKQN